MSVPANGSLMIGRPQMNALGMPPDAPSSLPPLTLDDDSGIFARLRRRKLSFGLTFGAVIGVVAAAYFMVPRSYRATASVIVSSADVVLGTPQSPATQQNIGDPADLESQSAVLSSTLLLHQVLAQPQVRQALVQECEMRPPSPLVEALKARIGLAPAQTCEDTVDDTASEITTLQNRYIVSASGRSRVIDVSFGSPSPESPSSWRTRWYRPILTSGPAKSSSRVMRPSSGCAPKSTGSDQPQDLRAHHRGVPA